MNYNNLYLVIPAYEPDKMLIDLVSKLNHFFDGCKIVIINDGSKNSDDIFKQIQDKDNVTLLVNETNKGKGYSLKKGFSYINSLDNDNIVVITCDADGQHKVEDIKKLADYKLSNDFKGIVLGSRSFSNMPPRSKFGNQVSTILFRIVNGIYLSDNQTGLRAFSKELMPFLMKVHGNKYEYEMNVLSEASRREIPINEIKIETVYIDNNSSSHFRPVRDFLRIVGSILKYSIPNLLLIILEIALFVLFFLLFSKSLEIFVSILLSGTVSGAISISCFLIMRHFIRYNKKTGKIKYMLFVASSLVINSLATALLYLAFENITGAKIINEIIILGLSMLARHLILPKPKII